MQMFLRFLLAFFIATAASHAQSPFADAFANAGTVGLAQYPVSTTNATVETSESLSEIGGAQTVWVKVGAIDPGPVRVSTEFSRFVTVTVFQGTTLSNLSALGSGDDADGSNAEVVFDVAPGQTYYIQVATLGNSPGDGTVNLSPANDRFATPRTVTWTNTSPTLTNVNTTAEVGEPDTTVDQGHSVWFRWVAPRTAQWFIYSEQASIPRSIDIYRGDSLASLVRFGHSEQEGQNPSIGSVIAARAGEEYRIRVQRLGAAFDAEGIFTLYFLPQPVTNDAFSARAALGTGVTARGPLAGATLEIGEPFGTDGVQLSGSSWFTWDAPTDGQASFDSTGSDMNTVLRIFTGPNADPATFNNLTLFAANDDITATVLQARVFVPVISGQRYYVQLGTKAGFSQEGIASLRVEFAPNANVHFGASRIIWSDTRSPFLVPLERDGSPTLPLVVNIRHVHFDGTTEDTTATFADGQLTTFIEGTSERTGPFNGGFRTTYVLLPGDGYAVGVPAISTVENRPNTPFPGVNANCVGLIERTDHDALGVGKIKVKLTNAGSYTLRIVVGSNIIVLKGDVDARGRITRTVFIPGLGNQILDAQVNPLFPAVTGTLGDSYFYAAAAFNPTLATTLFNATPIVAIFVPADGTGPQGAAYATGAFGEKGSVRLAGQMPDGTPFTVGTRISSDFTIPVYASLYGGRGQLQGFFLRHETPTPGFAAQASWVKPATGTGEIGGAVNQELIGYAEAYKTPSGSNFLSQGFIDTAGAGTLQVGLAFDEKLDLKLQFGNDGSVTFTDPRTYAPKLKIDGATGFFHGKVTIDAGGPMQKIKGVFIPQFPGDAPIGQGAGFLIHGTDIRPVRLFPTAP